MRIRPLLLLTAAAVVLAGCGIGDARQAAIAEAAVKPLDMSTSLRPGLVGLPDYPATGWELSEEVPSDEFGSIDPSALESIGLRAEDVAANRQIAIIPDGDTLFGPTMDFCDGRYPSEELRAARLQQAAYDLDGNFSGISTEVVVYVNKAAAQQALAEVTAARKNCPTGRSFTARDGHKLAFEFHSAPGPSDTPLVDADSRLVVHTTMVVDGEARRAFLVYQVVGRVLAALYFSDDGSKPYNQTALDSFYALAGDIADRLRAASPALLNGESVLSA